MKIKTLLYVYEYILNLIDIFLLKKLYLHRDICEIVERLICENQHGFQSVLCVGQSINELIFYKRHSKSMIKRAFQGND